MSSEWNSIIITRYNIYTNYGLHQLLLYLSYDRWRGRTQLGDFLLRDTILGAIDDVCSGKGSRLIQRRGEREAQAKRKWNQKVLELVMPSCYSFSIWIFIFLVRLLSQTIQRTQGIHRPKQLSVEEPKLSVKTCLFGAVCFRFTRWDELTVRGRLTIHNG